MNYTSEEEDRLKAMLSGDGTATCPRCGSAMDRQGVPPRSEVSYVRDRIWLVCRGCHRSAVFDRRRL